MEASHLNNKRIAKNTLMLYFRMILTMLVSLYTSRVVLNVLGVEDYGTYNVVGGIVMMFGFFNGAMVSATQRFLSYEIGRNDHIQLRKTFNATLIIHIGIALLVIILAETIGLWFVNTQLNIAENRMEAARWVYQFSILSFAVSIIQVPYNSIIIAHERMNVYAYVSILEVILKLLVVFALTWISFDKLKLYGILLCVVSFIVAGIYRVYTKHNFKETKFEFVRDKKLFTTLISYSGWNLFGNIAAVAKGQGVSILLNIFFGTVVNAAQGIANQVQGAINAFVINFQVAMNPQIVKLYASNNYTDMYRLVFRGSKFSFYLLFGLSLPVLFETETIFKIWLNVVPDYTIIFTQLILVGQLIECISGPLMTTAQASGKIKIYQMVVGSLLILNLPITYLFLKSGFPPEISMVVGVLIYLIALVTRLIILKRIAKLNIRSFVENVLFKIMIIVVLSLLLPFYVQHSMQQSFLRLFIISIVHMANFGIIIYYVGLNKSERHLICELKYNVIRKIRYHR